MRQLKVLKRFTERNDKSIDQYLNEISKTEMLDTNEEVELARKIHEGDEAALEKLVMANLRFVVSVAKQYQNQGLTLGDLINEGNFGLIMAAKRFDETRGFKFISYAVWWIRANILRALADTSRMVRIPLNKIADIGRLTKALEEIEQKLERSPTVEELSEALDMEIHSIENAFLAQGRHLSLDAPLADSEENTLLDMLNINTEGIPDDKIIEKGRREYIKRILKKVLPKDEFEVIVYHFGLDGGPGLKLREIAEIRKSTRERVRQIREKGLKRLRKKALPELKAV